MILRGFNKKYIILRGLTPLFIRAWREIVYFSVRLTRIFKRPQSDSSADATGTAAEAVIKDGGGVNVVTGLTVGTSASDIVLDSVNITSGQTVTLNSGSFTHA